MSRIDEWPISHSGRIPSLDAVRGIAALVVVIHHCFLVLPAFSDFFFQWIFEGRRIAASGFAESALFASPLRIVWGGYEAVTLFYVLSGLVLALPWVLERPPSYLAFAVRRICRIYIPYLVAILGAAALAAWLRPQSEAAYPGISYWITRWNWGQPVTASALVDHVLMLGQTNNINGVVHSLIWEMRVSLIFPVLIWPIYRFGNKGALYLLLAICVVCGLLELSGRALAYDPVKTLFREIEKTFFYAHHFIVGALIAFNIRHLRSWAERMPGFVMPVVLVAGLLIFEGRWSTNAALQAAAVGVGSALVLVSVISWRELDRLLQVPALLWLGAISYSLYLVHVPLLHATILLTSPTVPLWVTLPIVPFASLLVGWAFHVAVADPAARLGARLTRKKQLPPWSGIDGDLASRVGCQPRADGL